jgi:imidazolonepropionase-like amidohydrolase
MRKDLAALGVLLIASTASAQTEPAPSTGAPSAESAAFVGVSVVPGDRPQVLRDQTVVVDRGRIVSMGPAAKMKVPATATRIDGKGKYLMPGIGDMHGHLWREGWPEQGLPLSLKLFVANGVTTVREMWGTPKQLAIRDGISRGEVLGPRVFVYGPAMSRETTPSPDVAKKQVREYKEAGYDGVKVYEGLTAATYEALVRTAKEVRLPFAGHVPNSVGLARALAAGQKSVEHLDGYVEALANDDLAGESFEGPKPPPSENSIFLAGRPTLLARVDESRTKELVAATRKARAVNVPTVFLMGTLFNELKVESLRSLPELKYWPPGLVQNWVDQQTKQQPRPEAELKKWMGLRELLVKRLVNGGVSVMVGSDAPGRFAVPGFSMLREVEGLVKAGMTPAQVVRAATLEVAQYFGLEKESGTVGVGKRADLILADGNPLEDVANIFRTSGVMVHGRWIPRSEIDAQLSEIEHSLHYPTGSEVKDLPIASRDAAGLAGSYAFPAPSNAKVFVLQEKGGLVVSPDAKGSHKKRLLFQGDGQYLLPDDKFSIRFEMQGARAAAMRLSSPGWIDWRGPRVP